MTTALPDVGTRARASLRWNAASSVSTGLAAIAFSGPLAPHLDVERWLVVVIGAVVAGWGAMVWALSRRPSWRGPTTTAAIGNLAAGSGIAAWAVLHAGAAGAVLGLAALHALGFALHQMGTVYRG